MTRVEVDELLKFAIDRVIERELAILDLDVTERALSHQVALYLSEKIQPPLSVDCEYNRHFHSPKRLNLPPRAALDREIRATTVFPDIVIHERNTDAQNLLVLELKKPGESIEYDTLKLRAFQTQLGYVHAAHVILGRGADDSIVRRVEWING